MSKNTRNRILLTALAALLLVVVAVGGTVAWLTDKTDEIKNTFTTANVDIELAETKGDTFKLVPGMTYEKDPKVTVKANSEDCWLFVKVVDTTTATTLTWELAEGWTELENGVYYREVSTNAADQTFEIIKDNTVKVPETLTNETMPAAAQTLTFTAYACQKSSFDTAAAAWTELDKSAE